MINVETIVQNYFIDILILIYFIVMLIKGFKDGFIALFYNLASLIFILIFTMMIYKPLSNLITIYTYNNDLISSVVGPVFNSTAIFIIVFVILFILRIVIGLALKPMLTSLNDKFHITKTINHFLGMILSAVQSLVIIYIVLVLIFLPFIPESQKKLAKNPIAYTIVNSVSIKKLPISSDTLKFQHISDKKVLEELLHVYLYAYKNGLISEEKATQFLEKQLSEDILRYNPQLSKEDKTVISKIIKKTKLSSPEQTDILNHIGE